MFALFDFLSYNENVIVDLIEMRSLMRRPAVDINTKQKQVLDFIISYMEENYRCPSVREIGAAVGLSSSSTVQSHLNTLERFGYIKRDTNKNRAITVLSMPKRELPTNEETREVTSSEPFEFMGARLRQVPLIGNVAAGTPITAEQNQEFAMPLPTELTGNSECFMLRVHGESMRDIGMYEGDMIIVRNQSTANNGDVVVARVDDEATVKRFFRENGYIRLQPENDSYEPIIVKDCVIEGKVIGLIRERI